VDFTDFVLAHLPPPPARVLEVGCGDRGGVVPVLLEAGYEALGVDPRAPSGPAFRQVDFREVEGEFGAVVAGRVLHHLHPLGEALDRLAALAPVLVVDDFAWDLIDAGAQDWYEGQYRMLAAAGSEPKGPRSLDEWRAQHPDVHPHNVLLDALRARYEERVLEWGPYFHRWLGGPSSEALEQTLTAIGAFPAIGWRWAGVRPVRR
jgi:hypothetical protein